MVSLPEGIQEGDCVRVVFREGSRYLDSGHPELFFWYGIRSDTPRSGPIVRRVNLSGIPLGADSRSSRMPFYSILEEEIDRVILLREVE